MRTISQEPNEWGVRHLILMKVSSKDRQISFIWVHRYKTSLTRTNLAGFEPLNVI